MGSTLGFGGNPHSNNLGGGKGIMFQKKIRVK